MQDPKMEARLEALKFVKSQGVKPDFLIEEAERYAQYIINGKAGASPAASRTQAAKVAPSTAGKAPAGKKPPPKKASRVPAQSAGEASEEEDIKPSGGRPSERGPVPVPG